MPSPVTCEVLVAPGEDIDHVLRRFKKLTSKVGLFRECRRKMYYMNPSQAARFKRMRAASKRRKAARDAERNGDYKPPFATSGNGANA
jgi:ribosomal protein S21